MLWLQWGALVVGIAALLFFAVFTGYYFRNRGLAMDARRRVGPDGATAEAAEADGRPDGGAHSAQG